MPTERITCHVSPFILRWLVDWKHGALAEGLLLYSGVDRKGMEKSLYLY